MRTDKLDRQSRKLPRISLKTYRANIKGRASRSAFFMLYHCLK